MISWRRQRPINLFTKMSLTMTICPQIIMNKQVHRHNVHTKSSKEEFAWSTMPQANRCRIVGCNNHSNRVGLWRRHGTRDTSQYTRRITAFGSEQQDESIATQTIPNQRASKASTRGQHGSRVSGGDHPLSRYCAESICLHINIALVVDKSKSLP